MSIWLCRACASRRGTLPGAPVCTSATPVSSHDDSMPRISMVCQRQPSGHHAVSVVAHVAVVVLNLYQAVDVGLKTGAELGEFARELEVVDDFLVEHFARNQQRNAGWVGCDQAGGDAPFQVINGHALGFALRNVGIGVA